MEMISPAPASAANDSATAPSPARATRKATAQSVVRLLPTLIEAGRWGFNEKFRDMARQVAETLQPDYPAVSSRILRYCPEGQLKPLPTVPEKLLSHEVPSFGLNEVVLTPHSESLCRAIIAEHDKVETLRAVNLHPRHKVLLQGVPGTGKTMLAGALAHELKLPMFRARYGNIVDSYLGGTNKNLESVFEFVGHAPCVLFFDEFDGVAMDRRGMADVGEIRRVTNQLLLLMDRLPATCVFIAATNTSDLIDRAVRRRFDFVVEFNEPDDALRTRCAQKALTQGVDLSKYVGSVASIKFRSLSGVVHLCEDIRRDYALNGGANIDSLLLRGATSDELVQ